jgi:hypothetical protein
MYLRKSFTANQNNRFSRENIFEKEKNLCVFVCHSVRVKEHKIQQNKKKRKRF